jgi:hypothetical protein
MDVEKFLKVLLSLYVRKSRNHQDGIYHIRKVCVHQFVEKVGIHELQKDDHACPVDGQLFELYLHHPFIVCLGARLSLLHVGYGMILCGGREKKIKKAIKKYCSVEIIKTKNGTTTIHMV